MPELRDGYVKRRGILRLEHRRRPEHLRHLLPQVSDLFHIHFVTTFSIGTSLLRRPCALTTSSSATLAALTRCSQCCHCCLLILDNWMIIRMIRTILIHNIFIKWSCFQEAHKRMRVKKLPTILALHLKRFKYVEQYNRHIKVLLQIWNMFRQGHFLTEFFSTKKSFVFGSNVCRSHTESSSP